MYLMLKGCIEMGTTQDFSGLYPPLIIPFQKDESLDLTGVESNLGKLLSQPLDGIVLPGSNSEAAFMTTEERVSLWRLCGPLIRAAGKRFIAGTGMETTAETIRMTRLAAELGAEATLMLPPYFYKPAMNNPAVLKRHYQVVADASPIPVLLYNVPKFSGVTFSPQLLVELAEHPNIVGVKDSSAMVTNMAYLKALRPDFQFFAGSGSALLPFLSIGASGGIMALLNFAAWPMRALVDAYQAGKNAEAMRIQLALAPINMAVTGTYGIPGVKYAMDRVGLCGGYARAPLLPLSQEGRDVIDRLLDEIQELLAPANQALA